MIDKGLNYGNTTTYPFLVPGKLTFIYRLAIETSLISWHCHFPATYILPQFYCRFSKVVNLPRNFYHGDFNWLNSSLKSHFVWLVGRWITLVFLLDAHLFLFVRVYASILVPLLSTWSLSYFSFVTRAWSPMSSDRLICSAVISRPVVWQSNLAC